MTEEEQKAIKSGLESLKRLVKLLGEKKETLLEQDKFDRLRKILSDLTGSMWEQVRTIILNDLYEVSNIKDKEELEKIASSFETDEKFSEELNGLKNKRKISKAFCDRIKGEVNHFDKNPAAAGISMYMLWLLYTNRPEYRIPKRIENRSNLVTMMELHNKHKEKKIDSETIEAEKKEIKDLIRESLPEIAEYTNENIKVLKKVLKIRKQQSTAPILTRAKNYISSGIQTILRPFQKMYKWATSGTGGSKVEQDEGETELEKDVVVLEKHDLVLGGMQPMRSFDPQKSTSQQCQSKPKPSKPKPGTGSLSY